VTREEWEELPQWPLHDLGVNSFARRLDEFSTANLPTGKFDLFRAEVPSEASIFSKPVPAVVVVLDVLVPEQASASASASAEVSHD
jgi:hypothetical protein